MEQCLAETEYDQQQQSDDEIFNFHGYPSSDEGREQYTLPVSFGSRVFAPRLFTSLLTAALLVLLLSLGRWQLMRAHDKAVLYDEFAAGSDATRAIDGATPAVTRYSHVEVAGRYDPARQILIDNMSNADGRAGYYVLTPLQLASGQWLLVNRGWVPVGESRAVKPNVSVPSAPLRIRGRADDLPKPGIHMGRPAPLAPPYPVVANFPSRSEIAQLLGEAAWSPAAEQVLLDASEPNGYIRRWQPPGFPPTRNLAYAVQWFGLALALFVIYVVTNTHRRSVSPA